MRFLGWEPSTIAVFLGGAVIFELVRVYVGHLHDFYLKTRQFLVAGALLGSLGLATTPFLIKTPGNFMVILSVASFFSGSAILTTVIDSHVTAITHPQERNRVGGVLQTLRLVGFAVGGIGGLYLYPAISFEYFISAALVLFLITACFSIALVNDALGAKFREESNARRDFASSLKTLWKYVSTGPPGLIVIFLMLYSSGLFMQDFLLEPFAIDVLRFDKTGVGRISAIWSVMTLIFVPVGAFLEPRVGRINIIAIGQLIAALGLLLLSASSVLIAEVLMFIGLAIFGIGTGLGSSPAISLMLDVAAQYKRDLTILLGLFGALVTIGRSIAGVMGGLLLQLTQANYLTVFIIEAILIVAALAPIVVLNRRVEVP